MTEPKTEVYPKRNYTPEPEIETCENCGSEALLMSVCTIDGWDRICSQCYKNMVIKEPRRAYKPRFWERVRGCIPDMRKSILEAVLRKIGRPICGFKPRECLYYSKNTCPSWCRISKEE